MSWKQLPRADRTGMTGDGQTSSIWRRGSRVLRIRRKGDSCIMNEFENDVSVREVVGGANFIAIMAREWFKRIDR